MKLHQRRYIPFSNPWEPNLFGYFFDNDNVACFAYKEARNLCLLSQTNEMPAVIHTDIGNNRLPLPSSWTFLEYDSCPYLMVQPNVIIDLRKGKQLSYISEPLQAKCLACYRPAIYYVEHQFCFDDYCISHKGECGYRCTKAGEMIWEFTGRAYLYTDIVRWKNRVFFGTAGNGGYFYILDIDTGKPITSIKTGGTASFVQTDQLCYFASRGTKRNSAKLLCVDLQDGRIVNELELKGTVNSYSRLQMIGEYLHLVTFEYKADRLHNAIWNMMDI